MDKYNVWDEILPEVQEAYAMQVPGHETEEVTIWIPVPENLMSEDSKTELINKLSEFRKTQPYVQFASLMPVSGIKDAEGNLMEFEGCTLTFFAFHPYAEAPWSAADPLIQQFRDHPNWVN